MQVNLKSENEKEWHFKAILRPGMEQRGRVIEGGRLNRRETEYEVIVDRGHAWKAVLLAMPNGRYAWRIVDDAHSNAGVGDYRASSTLALRDGVIPYIVTQELQQSGSGRQ